MHPIDRLQEKIRRDFTKETGKEMEEKPWEDWVASSKTTTKDKESDKANCATPSDQARDDTDSEAVQDVKEPGTHAEADIDTTRVLCSLPSEKSPNGKHAGHGNINITLSMKALWTFFCF